MNEAELVEAANSSWVLVTSAIGLYITVTSAYLIVAYLAGEELTKSQTKIISGLYIGLAIMLLAGLYTWSVRGNHYTLELTALESRASSFVYHDIPIFLTAVLTTGMLASLKFMWDVRHPKTE